MAWAELPDWWPSQPQAACQVLPMRPLAHDRPPTDLALAVHPSIVVTLTLRTQACVAARELRHDPREAALGLLELLAAVLSGTEGRWLVASGLAEHARERVRRATTCHSLRKIAKFATKRRSCFTAIYARLRLPDRCGCRNCSGPK
jgi:hypothetical protein